MKLLLKKKKKKKKKEPASRYGALFVAIRVGQTKRVALATIFPRTLDGAKEHQVPEKYEEGERAEKATDVGCQFGIIGSLKINTSTFLLPQSNARKLVKVFFTRRTSLVTHPITREKEIISNYQVEKLFSL